MPNVIAITCGLITTIYLGGLHVDFMNLFGLGRFASPPPITVAFTWFALIGAVVVFAIGLFFRTPEHVLAAAERTRAEAHHDDRPVALRG